MVRGILPAMRRPRDCALLVLALATVAVAASAPLPVVTRLSLQTAPTASQPGVALEPGRGFVVTWQEGAEGASTLNFAALGFDGRETSRGVIARGRDWFVNWADAPALAVLDNGDWVAFWLQRADPTAPEAYDIRVVRSTDRGRHWSAPVTPHRDGTPTQHGFVSLVPEGGDRVRIVWLDGRLAAEVAGSAASASNPVEASGRTPATTAVPAPHDEEAAPMTLRTALLDRRGRLRDEAVLDARTCSCCQTDALRAAGRTRIVYRDRSDDEVRDIAVVARGPGGAWSTPRLLHADGWRIEGCPVNGPAAAAAAWGTRWIALWPTLAGESLQLRYVLGDGDRLGEAQSVPTSSPPSGRVDAAAWGTGFLVTWVSRARDRPGVEFATIEAGGSATARPRIANPLARGRAAGFPRLASDGSTALVVWTESDASVAADGRIATAIGAALLRAE